MKTRPPVFAIAAILAVASLPAWAGNGSGTIGNLPDILVANLNIIADIMQTLAVLIGLTLFVGGMFQLKRYGEMRTMMSSQMSISGLSDDADSRGGHALRTFDDRHRAGILLGCGRRQRFAL